MPSGLLESDPLLSSAVPRSEFVSSSGGYRPCRKAVAVPRRMGWSGALA